MDQSFSKASAFRRRVRGKDECGFADASGKKRIRRTSHASNLLIICILLFSDLVENWTGSQPAATVP